MVGQIAGKEIRHNLYSIRFPALLVISTILFIFNAILAVTEPIQEMADPQPNTVATAISREHNKLQFCVQGTSADRNPGMSIMVGGVIEPETSYDEYSLPTGDHLVSFAIGYMDQMDWMFITKIVFSIFAISFTFDAICREWERGTLALMCANPVSRSAVLLGKYLGACGTLLMPLAAGMLLNLLIIVIFGGAHGAVSFRTEHWLRIYLLGFVSIIYMSLFVWLGLLVSTIAQRSSSSLLITLSLWVALVIVIPNVAGLIAEYTSEMESEYQICRRWYQVSNPIVVKKLNEQISSGRIRTVEELHSAAEIAYMEIQETVNDMRVDHQRSVIAKRMYARRMAMVSPAAICQYVGESIADSGFERQQRFLRSAQAYYLIYEDYVRSKVGKIVPWCESNFSTPMRFGERWVRISSPMPEYYRGDMSDFPHFTEPEWSVVDSLRTSLSNLLILFLWNVFLFSAAHYAFMKRSLR